MTDRELIRKLHTGDRSALDRIVEKSFHTVAVSGIVWMLPMLIRIMFGGMGYAVMCGTPLFLVMTGVQQDMYGVILIPAAVGAVTLIFCTLNGRRTYMLS